MASLAADCRMACRRQQKSCKYPVSLFLGAGNLACPSGLVSVHFPADLPSQISLTEE